MPAAPVVAHLTPKAQTATAQAQLATELSTARAYRAAGWNADTFTALARAIDAADATYANASATEQQLLAQARALNAARKALVKNQPTGTLADGYWAVSVTLQQPDGTASAPADAALEHDAVLYARASTTNLHLTLKPFTAGSLTGYLSQLSLLTDITYSASGVPRTYAFQPATVLSGYTIADTYNSATAADATLRNVPYPQKVLLPVDYAAAAAWVYAYGPILNATVNPDVQAGEYIALLTLDTPTLSRLEVSTDALSAALARARSIVSSQTAAAESASLAAGVTAAQAMLDRAAAVPQSALDTQAAALQARCDVIRATSAAPNTAALSSWIAKAEKLVPEAYSSDSYALLDDAVMGAKTALADTLATQYEVDARVRAIDTAINRLEPLSGPTTLAPDTATTTNTATKVSKTKLKALIAKAEKVKKSSYTNGSYTFLSVKLTAAKKVYKNAKATQEEIDKAYSELSTAYKSLTKATSTSGTAASTGSTSSQTQTTSGATGSAAVVTPVASTPTTLTAGSLAPTSTVSTATTAAAVASLAEPNDGADLQDALDDVDGITDDSALAGSALFWGVAVITAAVVIVALTRVNRRLKTAVKQGRTRAARLALPVPAALLGLLLVVLLVGPAAIL
jgi:hypothetical protein